MHFPVIIRYKDDKTLAVCMHVGHIIPGKAFTILAEKLSIVRRKK